LGSGAMRCRDAACVSARRGWFSVACFAGSGFGGVGATAGNACPAVDGNGSQRRPLDRSG
ncbi:hypothetical protein, partial [Geobacillus stearothermophilus]|uniref:hypothetical protein n=1 Tax=Geobacillus stearothermophilus TaxID=1422 RepID=UPI002EBBBDE2|nr:hypothetical protein [Geobacillus stearothermophilus]